MNIKNIEKELGISKEEIKRIKRLRKEIFKDKEKITKEREKSNIVVSIANTLFRGIALSLSNKEFFKNYRYELRKADIPLLFSSYLSLVLFISSTFFLVFLITSVILALYSTNILYSLIRNLFVSSLLSLLTIAILLFYPKIKIKNIERKIESELPFAALYLASISSSGVSPVKAFELLAESKEYKHVASQIKKVTNKINIFGMDIVTAIKETVEMIGSKKLKEMLNGLSTNIVTGGELKEYFEEEARRFLSEYKISREKYNVSAGIYADIYTGLLIAGPLIFMLVLVLINLFGGMIFGLTAMNIAVIGIFGLTILNIIFLTYLEIVTPPT